MTMQKFTDIQKERIINIIESKTTNKGICNCDNPNMSIGWPILFTIIICYLWQ